MKKQVLMCAPFNTRSGYGDHARSIFYSIMDREDIEIKCVDVRWGETPRNHLDPKIPKHKRLLDTFVDGRNLQQPDIYIDIRIPNEFQTPAKFNIGITAGVETDVVSPEFLMGCNQMDLNLGTSQFTVATFQRCAYDQQQDVNGSKQTVGSVKLSKPMAVLNEGIIKTVNDKSHYVKPSLKKKLKREAAQRQRMKDEIKLIRQIENEQKEWRS